MLAKKFTAVLEALKINKVSAANQLGVTKTAISDITNGRVRNLSGTMIELLRVKYEVNPEFWSETGGPMFLPSQDRSASSHVEPIDKGIQKALENLLRTVEKKYADSKQQEYPHGELREIPELGRIAAGALTEEVIKSGKRLLFPRMVIPDRGPLFMLRIRGDSMKDANIHDGDYAILRPVSDPKELKSGAIVAALVDGENTLKRLYRKDGGAVLRAANSQFKDIEVRHLQELVIQGVLKYIIKKWHDDE